MMSLHSCILPASGLQRRPVRAASQNRLARQSCNCTASLLRNGSHRHSSRVPTSSQRKSTQHSQRLVSVAGSLAVSPYIEGGKQKLTPNAKRVTDFALRFSFLTETYEVHTWHLVLGLLQVKDGIAADVLREKGIEDFHEAFLEVLYCLKMADALDTKGFRCNITFTNRAVHVLEHARYIAATLGHEQMDTEHILAALAYYEVLETLFPDLSLDEESVWKAINRKWESKGMKSDLQLLETHSKEFEKIFAMNPKRLAYFPDLKRLENFDPSAAY